MIVRGADAAELAGGSRGVEVESTAKVDAVRVIDVTDEVGGKEEIGVKRSGELEIDDPSKNPSNQCCNSPA